QDSGSGGATPTFTTVFASFSGCISCHSGVSAAGSLNLATQAAAYKNLVNAPAHGAACVSTSEVLVVPGSSATSLLFTKIKGTQDCGSPMTGPSSAQIDALKAWIDNGAVND